LVHDRSMNSQAGFQDAIRDGKRVITCAGDWTIGQASGLSEALHQLPLGAEPLQLSLAEVTALDTVGAWLVQRTLAAQRAGGREVALVDVSPAQAQIIDHVRSFDAPKLVPRGTSNVHPLLTPLADIGVAAEAIASRFALMLAFLGAVMVALVKQLGRPRSMRWNALTHQLEQVGYQALPIVGLLSFLIGLVLVQQGAYQLKQFGAEVFVIDLVSITTLRELGVLVCAILVAGRSGSAFAAQIGSMKLQEELDAMRTIGLDPIQVLVLPRAMALVIVMPLLGFYSSMMALVGGALFTYLQLGIPIDTFLERMQETVTMDTFLVGMIKAPIFGLVIAVVGCFEGLQVEGGAQSVGERTTMAVVISIFMVIVLDAFLAVFFTTIGM
jgi:phospholipid/cholesterol/gamma-HCH transport system permease protein